MRENKSLALETTVRRVQRVLKVRQVGVTVCLSKHIRIHKYTEIRIFAQNEGDFGGCSV